MKMLWPVGLPTIRGQEGALKGTISSFLRARGLGFRVYLNPK